MLAADVRDAHNKFVQSCNIPNISVSRLSKDSPLYTNLVDRLPGRRKQDPVVEILVVDDRQFGENLTERLTITDRNPRSRPLEAGELG